jgi:hypothetical protein
MGHGNGLDMESVSLICDTSIEKDINQEKVHRVVSVMDGRNEGNRGIEPGVGSRGR